MAYLLTALTFGLSLYVYAYRASLGIDASLVAVKPFPEFQAAFLPLETPADHCSPI